MMASWALLGDDTVALRRALIDDCERVWEWNFAPEVRALSRDRRVITFTEHVRWYQQRLDVAHDPMWIVLELRSSEDQDGKARAKLEHGVAVGVVRLDGWYDEYARISIALAGRARGRGIGRRAIAAVCAAVRRPITAEVLASNPASLACFEACGFATIGERDALVTLQWRP